MHQPGPSATDSDGGDEEPPAEEEETWLHFATGFIPVYDSARDAYESFRDGNYLTGAVNVGFTVFDIATFGAGGTGAKAILKGGVVGVKALAKAGLKETIETAAIKGFQAAKGGLDNIGGKLLSGGATAAGKVASGLKTAGRNVAKSVVKGAGYFDELAIQATRNPASNKVVLGKTLQGGVAYSKVAAHHKASYFKLDNWRELTKTLTSDEIWQVNRAFLQQQISAGKQIILSHDPAQATGFFLREIEYLEDLGYHFVQDGWIWKAID